MQEMYEQARSLVKAKDYAQAEHLLLSYMSRTRSIVRWRIITAGCCLR